MVGGIILSVNIIYLNRYMISLSQYEKFVEVWVNDISYFQPDL